MIQKGLAEAYVGLGEVYFALGKKDMAQEKYLLAIDGFESLGIKSEYLNYPTD